MKNITEEWQLIVKKIEQNTKQPFVINNIDSVSGGCINSAFILQSENSSYFIKLNQAKFLPMFEAEFAGLKELRKTKTIRIPQPIVCGISADKTFLVLENTPLTSSSKQSDTQLGQKLAALHQIRQPFFGWHIDNTIGSTPQPNPRSENWVSFWQTHRLGFQLCLAETNGYGGRLIQSGKKLSEVLHFFLVITTLPHLFYMVIYGLVMPLLQQLTVNR